MNRQLLYLPVVIAKMAFVITLTLVFGVFSTVVTLAQKVGSLIIFQKLTHLPFRLLFSQEEAIALRNDFLFVLEPTFDILIENHFPEGYGRRLELENIQTEFDEGSQFLKKDRLADGEFGISLLLTGIALLVIYLDVTPPLAQYISICIGVTSIILLFAVGTRRAMMDAFAFKTSAGGSVTQNIKRVVWNDNFLSRRAPISRLVLLKIAYFGGPDLYRLTLYSLGKSFEQALQTGEKTNVIFYQSFVSEFVQFVSNETLSDQVPSADTFELLAK